MGYFNSYYTKSLCRLFCSLLQNSLDFSAIGCRIVGMNRKQKQAILQDLAKKMVFLVGPRQVGKTWLAKDIGLSFEKTVYLNYDNLEDQKIIKEVAWLESTQLLILDELHKMPDWKNYLKGIYDTKSESLSILVTGGARLDIIKQIGDSLAGRFYLHRLLPFSPAEFISSDLHCDLEKLIARGGYPEPYLAESDIEANRWRMHYMDSLLRTDAFDYNQITNIKSMQLVFQLLQERVGSPISYQSIAEDAKISPHTVKKYIEILEALYIIFCVTPFSKNIARSLVKQPKIYFFDNGLVKGGVGEKLENFLAICLLKHTYANIDSQGENCALHYLRTKDGQEIDFALVKENKIEKIIEVKQANNTISPPLQAFHKKYQLPAIQLIKELRQEKISHGIEIRKLMSFLEELNL